jgi:hypothetical protein
MASLELVTSKNNNFKEKYPEFIKKIKSRKLKEVDPKIDEITSVNDIIKKFIVEKKRKIYGGFALNLLLTAKDKSLALYDVYDAPDIDFYSPEPLNDLKELCDRIYDAGFKPVIGQEAQHKETYSIYVNYQLYCDISYMPNNIYKKTRYINTNEFTLIHPWFAMIDYFRMFTDPMVSYWRLEKHYERYMLLQKTYPLPLITESLYFDPFKDKGVNEVMNLIFNELTNYQSILFTGFYAYNYYLNQSSYNKYNKNYDYINIPYYEVYSTNYIDDGLKLLSFISSLPEHISSRITHIEHYPFFQFYGYNTVFYYNDGNNQIPILYLYSNNKRCLPYKNVNLITFNKKTVTIDTNKKINIGSFDQNILHALIILVKIRVDDDNGWNDILYKYINGIVLFRNYYFSINKLSLYDETIFQSFVIDCIGDYILPERERRLVIEARKKLGKPYIFKYEPGNSKNIGKYLFLNSSGNPINKKQNFKLTEENRNTNFMDELEKEEITELDIEQETDSNKENPQ